MNTNNNNENVYFTLIENEIIKKDDLDIHLFFDELYNENDNENANNITSSEETYELYPQYYHYDMNFTIQQLLLICDYYNIVKSNKLKKENKINIIHKLIEFENEANNYELVLQRKKFWFYMNELKNDKVMKKYILW